MNNNSNNSATCFFQQHRDMLYILAKLVAVFAICLFVYGSMIPRFGYHMDEMHDFSGNGIVVYMANGRWGLALWKFIFGLGIGAWTAGVLACLFMSAYVLLNMKLLRLSGVCNRCIFIVLSVVLPQFAYMMTYSIQSDAVAFGLLLSSVAAYLTTRKEKISWFLAVFLVSLTSGIYQPLMLNYVVMIVFLVLFMLISMERGWLSLAIKGILVSICSLMMYFSINKIVLEIANIPAEVINRVVGYQKNMVNYDGVTNLWDVVYIFLHYGKLVLKNALYPTSYPGEVVYASAIVPLLLLFYKIWFGVSGMKPMNRIFACVLVGFIWSSPFLMILVMWNEWPCAARMRLVEPLAFAGLWAMALSRIQVKKRWRYVLLIACGVLLVRSSLYVTQRAAAERGCYERTLWALLNIEQEATKMALDAGITPSRNSILCFRGYPRNKDGNVSFYCLGYCCSHPALKNMRYGVRQEELQEHYEELIDMPTWPAKGSMRVHKGKVIINAEIYDVW